MTQSKRHSVAEAITSTVVGLGVAFVMNFILYAAYHIPVSTGVNVAITMWMTLVSLIRGYILRRMFNGSHWRKLFVWGALVYAAAVHRNTGASSGKEPRT